MGTSSKPPTDECGCIAWQKARGVSMTKDKDTAALNHDQQKMDGLVGLIDQRRNGA
jgi:hypothetical protein